MGDPRPPDDVVAYYESNVEADRLDRGQGALEFARTKELLSRFLPEPVLVADVGGGAGHYAEWLADEGHDVDLVDPIPRHLELAHERAGQPPRFRVHAADARDLPFENRSFDAVLLLGPLYHLGEKAERGQALAEAARICRPGGVIAAAAICRYAPLLDALVRGLLADPEVFRNVQVESAGGRRVRQEQRKAPFPDAYFHLPDELQTELAAAGLEVEGVFPVEGPAVIAHDLDRLWENDDLRERFLWTARLAESDPRLQAVTAHFLGVARRPANR
jgi:SAM-dependent methyltransferase